MQSVESFRPFFGASSGTGTISISAGTASASTGTLLRADANTQISCRIHNAGLYLAFVNFSGTSTLSASVATTASSGSMPIPSGDIEVVNIDQAKYVAAIATGGVTTLYFTTGYGL